MPEQESLFDTGARREWLVRCIDREHELGLCTVEANDGQVEIISPHKDVTTLHGPEVIDFRDALDAAICRAEADLSAREGSVPEVVRPE